MSDSNEKRSYQDLGLAQHGMYVHHGRVQGYYTVVSIVDNNSKFLITVGVRPDNPNASLDEALQQIRQIKQVEEASLEGNIVKVKGSVSLRTASQQEKVAEIFDVLIPALRSQNYGTGSYLSGIDDASVKLTRINNTYSYLSENDYRATLGQLEQSKQQIADTRENVPLGTVGAIIGALLGGVLWVVIGRIGYYAWFAGFLAIFAAFYGYRMLGKRVSRQGSIIVYAVSIIVIFLASLTEWAWRFYDELKKMYQVTFFEVWKATPELLMQNPELRRRFLIDIAIGLGIVIVAGIFLLRQLYREHSGVYDSERWNADGSQEQRS